MGDRAWENLNEEAMPLLMGVVLLTDFTPVVCRDERLMEAFEHRNAIYGARYPKTSVPNISAIARNSLLKNWRSSITLPAPPAIPKA